jgi:hypothetical protein
MREPFPASTGDPDHALALSADDGDVGLGVGLNLCREFAQWRQVVNLDEPIAERTVSGGIVEVADAAGRSVNGDCCAP